MNQYIYKIQPVRSDMLTDGGTEEENRIVGIHFNYLKDLTEKGTVVLAGRTLNTDSSSFGVVIFLAEDAAAAHQIMRNDPAIINRVFRGEVFPYRIALVNTDPLKSS